MTAFYLTGSGDYTEVRCANGIDDMFVSDADNPIDGWKIAERKARKCAKNRGTKVEYRDLPSEANANEKTARAAWVVY